MVRLGEEEKLKKIKDYVICGQTDLEIFYKDSSFVIDAVGDGVEVWQYKKRIGFFESFDLMVENLVVDGVKFIDILNEIEF